MASRVVARIDHCTRRPFRRPHATRGCPGLRAYITVRPRRLRCPAIARGAAAAAATKDGVNQISEYILSRKSRPVPLVFPTALSQCRSGRDGRASVGGTLGHTRTTNSLWESTAALAFTCGGAVTEVLPQGRLSSCLWSPPCSVFCLTSPPARLSLFFFSLLVTRNARRVSAGNELCRLAAITAAWSFN